MASGRRDSSPGRLALAFPSIWKKVRYRWSPHRVNSVDLGASTGSLSEALVYPWIVHQQTVPPDGRPRSLSCQLPGPPLRLWDASKVQFQSCHEVKHIDGGGVCSLVLLNSRGDNQSLKRFQCDGDVLPNNHVQKLLNDVDQFAVTRTLPRVHQRGEWQLLVDDDASSGKSPGNSPRNSFSSTGSVASQASSSKDNRSEHSQGSRAGLAKLARLLTPREKSVAGDRPASHGSDNSLALDIVSLRKANSIDSLLESSTSAYNLDIGASEAGSVSPATPGSNNKALPASPSVPAKLESQRKGNGPSTSPTVSSKHAKESRQGSLERIIDSGPLTKAERKKLEKVNKFNIDLQALFASVEHEQLERARSILKSSNVDINSMNGDGFTPLDLAVMTTNVAMVQLLQSHGASESSKFPCRDSRSAHLQAIMREAARCTEDLDTCVRSAATNGSLSQALLKEKERQLSLWQRRYQLLKKMKTGFDHLRPPDPPSSVQLEVVGTRSLKVKFTEPETAHYKDAIVTKYKVEWSCYEDFSLLAGSREIQDVQKLELMIPDLTQGSTYFVRVAAGNVKGFSEWKCASPLSAIPSCWRDVEGKVPRSAGRMGTLDDLFHQIINSRGHGSEIKDLSETPQQQRRQVRKSIKHLFTSAPKFQKNMKRGVFLACLLYHDDRIIVTAEDTLPILEVDETYPSPLHTDFHWLMKVACTWEDVKTLRQDMEKSQSSSNVHFRSKILQAVEQMQAALGLQDLGQLYYLPLKDSEGTTVLCTVKHVKDPKTMVTLSVRWMPLYKVQRKRINNSDSNGDNPVVNDLLLDTLQEMILYSQVSSKPLTKGLYVGYMKLKSSVDAIRVVVPRLTPNVLPHIKIRDNPHVSCEEWQWFKSLSTGSLPNGPSEIQMKFQKALSAATRQLLTGLDIPENMIDLHRYYDVEVIELSEDVSFILVLPPVDSVCSVPGQCDEITSRSDCIPLPIQIFEMIHMTTYQSGFITRYSRLSSILEMDNMLAHHAHREAFSSTELSEAKSRLNQLQEFQTQVDSMWRAVRWIMDVLTFARDKQGSNGVSLKDIWTNNSSPELPSPPSPEEKKPVSENHKISPSPSVKLQTRSKKQIRRCSSTSRLQINYSDMLCDRDSINCGSKAHSAERLGDSNFDKDSNYRNSLRSSFAGSFKSLSSADITVDEDKLSVYSKDSACSIDEDCHKDSEKPIEDGLQPNPAPSQNSGIIRVYAAYETGLPSGTSVKLHITPQTTAREVVDLVVKQLNMAVILKGRGGPIYGNSQLHSFCLVATAGARERCLCDEFQPMKLQGPWLKGKLFVRRKDVVNGD